MKTTSRVFTAAVLLAAAAMPAHAGIDGQLELELAQLCTKAGKAAGHDSITIERTTPAEDGIGYLATGHVGEPGEHVGFQCHVSSAMAVEEFHIAPAGTLASVPEEAMAACASMTDEHWNVDTGISMPGQAEATEDGMYMVEMTGPGRHCTCKVTADGQVMAINDG